MSHLLENVSHLEHFQWQLRGFVGTHTPHHSSQQSDTPAL